MASAAHFTWDDPLLLDQQLSDDERAVRDAAYAYCQQRLLPRVQHAFRHEQTDPAIFREMGELGLLGPTIPTEYGGPGGDFLHACVVTEEMVRVGANLGIPVHSDMVSPYLLHYGSEALKQKFLPRLCAGEIIGSNQEAVDAPEAVNAEPYGVGWMLRIRPADPNALADLMSAEQYIRHVAENG